MATRNGMIKKTSIPHFSVSRSSKVMPCIKLKEKDELVSVTLCYENDELLLVSREGRYNKYSSDILSDLATRAMGVAGINVKGDSLAGVVSNQNDGNEILLCSNRGGFKRLHFNDLSFTSRNTKGTYLFKQIKSNPHSIVKVDIVSSYTNLLFMNNEKLAASEIPFMSLDSSFSMPLNIDNYAFIKDDMSDIKEAKIVDLPTSYSQDDAIEEFVQTDLF